MADELFDLSGKLAWITGSSRNLGKAIVDDLARQGADVIVSNNTHDEERAETVADLRERHDVDVYGVQGTSAISTRSPTPSRKSTRRRGRSTSGEQRRNSTPSGLGRSHARGVG